MAEHLAELNKGELDVYSTNKVQVGVWTNGKPFYRQSFKGKVKAANNIVYLPIGSSVDEVISQSWEIRSGATFSPIPVVNDAVNGVVRCAVLNNSDATHPNTLYAYEINIAGYVDVDYYATIEFTII